MKMVNHHIKGLLTGCCLVFASSSILGQADSRITIKHKDLTLKQALREIEKQSKLAVAYNESHQSMGKKLSLEVVDQPVSDALASILSGTGLVYKMENDHIIITPSDANKTIKKGTPKTITGKVVDEKGEPLIGVNIQVKGSSTGTISDYDGNYSILAAPGEDLVFSYIGYMPKTIAVGKSNVQNMTLQEDTKRLNEVVVTAMGIERKSETLTYATQTVGGNELTRAKETNLVNSLQGKSAGLVITPNSGGAGSASKILLRGNSSILGNNSPLIVVDGVPMSNKVSGQLDMGAGGAELMAGSGEGGDALSQLNPDDIASITVLKGGNAAALYGSHAANGVLMITTKKGQQGAMRISLSSSTTFEKPLVLPRIQNIYGSEVKGNKEAGYYIQQSSWGGKLADMSTDELNPLYSNQRLTNQPYDMADFFRTGTNLNNTVSFSGGTEVVQSYFSYGNTTANGMMPNNFFSRHNMTLRENFSFFKNKLKINVSANYIAQYIKNRPGAGGMYSTLANLYTSARNADLNYYRKNFHQQGSWMTDPYQVFQKNEAGEYVLGSIQTTLNGEMQSWYLQNANGQNNPWWSIYRNTGKSETNHFLGNVGFTYSILKGLDLQARLRYDYANATNESRQTATTMLPSSMSERGRLIWNYEYNREFYGDFLLSYYKVIGDYNFNVNGGGSMMRAKSNYWKLTPTASSGQPYKEDQSFNQFVLKNIYMNGGYGSDITGGGLSAHDWECSLFGTANASYKDYVTIDGSYRIDWYRAFTQFKNMPTHFSYYSVGANTQVANLVDMPELINGLKLRLSYSVVGNSIPGSLFLKSAARNPATGAYVMSGIEDFKNPKPETTHSLETGFELNMFNRAFNVDFTYYHALMQNQFMSYGGASGKTVFVNSGKVLNQGVEVSASYILAPNNDFTWKTGLNFSYNDNTIKTTAKKQNGKDLLLEYDLGNSSGLKVKFMPGGSYGDLYATDFLRDKDGNIRINKTSGKPSLDQGNSTEYLGNMNAKYNLGWQNTFSYKNFNFMFLIDGKIGGKIVSFTEGFLDYYGVSQRTADMRLKAERENIIWTNKKGEQEPGVVMPDGRVTSLEAYYTSIGGATPLGKNYVYDGTNFRMREISFGYTFQNLFGQFKNLTLSANGRNLFFLYKKAPIDPDTSLSTQNALGNVDVFGMPTTRTFGFTINATF
ncbi:MAG: SusC/RagA family TonB-linked outer membrane protein [Bacteroidales bacterium]